MTKSLLALLLALGVAIGCSSNKASTPDNTSSAQPSAASGNTNASNSNPAATTGAPSASTNNPDESFINDAAKGNRAEVELGKMVQDKASDPSVKKFAKMMVDDHTKALNELQQVAQKKNITLPDGIPDDAQDLQNKLKDESGKQLDKDYMDAMVQDHQKDVQKWQDASQNAQDKDVKQYASKTLPTLQKHLQKAQQVDSKLNGGKSKSASQSGD